MIKKYQATINYLSRYKESMTQLSQLSDRLATLRSKVGNATGSGLVVLDKGRSTTVLPSDPLYDESMQIIEVEKQLSKQLKESAELEREITGLILTVLPNNKYPIESEILLNIYVYTYSIDRVYRSMDMIRKTFDYYKDKALGLMDHYLTSQGLIIPLQMQSGYERLIEKLTN